MRKGRAPPWAPDTTTTTAWTRGCAAGFGRGNPAMCTHWHRSACRLFMRMMQASRASLGSRCRVGSEDGHAACARSSTGGCERADTVHRPAYLVHVDHDVGETAGCEVESGDRRDLDARVGSAWPVAASASPRGGGPARGVRLSVRSSTSLVFLYIYTVALASRRYKVGTRSRPHRRRRLLASYR